MKTSELTGAALNWAVHYAMHGECEGYSPYVPEYSTNWSQGGPIIERESLLVRPSFTDERGKWTSILWASASFFESGPTPLIAAMRCYVASKLGDEIEIPTELGESK